MSSLKYPSLFFILLCLNSFLSYAQEKVEYRHRIETTSLFRSVQLESQDFTRIELQGYTHTQQIGAPRMPVKTELIEIPHGAEIEVRILNSRYHDLNLKTEGFPFPLEPTQAPIRKKTNVSAKWAFDKKLYKKNQFIKSDRNESVYIKELGQMRDKRMALLTISPFSYHPKAHRLRVYDDITFEIIFHQTDSIKLKQQKTVYAYDNAKNKQAFPYVIVADSLFQTSLQAFIQWKTTQGYKIIEAYTSDPKVGKSNTEIRAYLKNLYENANVNNPPPAYVLLVGDAEQIPPFNSQLKDTPEIFEKNHITDLYYAEYTNDFLPDLFLGRLSARTTAELDAQLDKIIQTEKGDLPSWNFMDSCILIAGYDNLYGNSHLNPQIRYAQEFYFNEKNGSAPKVFLYPESKNMTSQLENAFSSGASFVVFTGHGTQVSWADPLVTKSFIERLKNENKYPFVIANCCLSGSFQIPECIGESMLRADKKGAVGYIGASNNTYFNEDFYWAIGCPHFNSEQEQVSYENTRLGVYDKWLHTHGEAPEKWAVSAGQIMQQGNLSVLESNSILQDYYWEVYHLFGDPSFQPYGNRPQEQTPSHPPSILQSENNINIQSEAFAYAALSSQGKLYGAALADINGKIQIHLNEYCVDTLLNLQITTQFHRPYSKEIKVLKNENAWIILDSFAIKNIDNKQYAFRMRMQNTGKNKAENIRLEAYGNHPSVSTIHAFEFPLVLNEDSSVILDPILMFNLNGYISDKDAIDFYITVFVKDTQCASFRFFYEIQAPKPILRSHRIEAFSKKIKRRQLFPGDSAFLFPTFENVGSLDMQNLKCVVKSPQIFLQFPNDTIALENLKLFSPTQISVPIYVDAHAPLYEKYLIQYFLIGENRCDTLFFTAELGACVEDFEDASDTLFPWFSVGTPWLIDTSEVFEGYFSAHSGNISDDDTSQIDIKITVPENDSISFYYKVESEAVGFFGDFLYFYIDNHLLMQGGGRLDWTQASFPISKGEHLLSWSYQKDRSVSIGKDKAWIDYIRFPRASSWTVQNEIENPLKKTENKMSIRHEGSNISVNIEAIENGSGKFYVLNLLGQKVYNSRTSFTLLKGEHETISFSLPLLPTSIYIGVLELQSSDNSKKILTTKFCIL